MDFYTMPLMRSAAQNKQPTQASVAGMLATIIAMAKWCLKVLLFDRSDAAKWGLNSAVLLMTDTTSFAGLSHLTSKLHAKSV
jgi:hypothetical protein